MSATRCSSAFWHRRLHGAIHTERKISLCALVLHKILWIGFENFWFATGSPQFLIKQMRKITFYNVENAHINNMILEKYDIENLELIPLLFQTGYLTIKSIDAMTGNMVLDYPNHEVRQSMYAFLIDDVAKNPQRIHTGMTIEDLKKAFVARDLEKVKDKRGIDGWVEEVL